MASRIRSSRMSFRDRVLDSRGKWAAGQLAGLAGESTMAVFGTAAPAIAAAVLTGGVAFVPLLQSATLNLAARAGDPKNQTSDIDSALSKQKKYLVEHPLPNLGLINPKEQNEKIREYALDEARKQFNKREHLTAGQIQQSIWRVRRFGGVARTYADTIHLGNREKLLPAAYIQYLLANCDDEEERKNLSEFLKAEKSANSELGQDTLALESDEAYAQALIEKKANLLVGRFYAAFRDVDNPNGGLRAFIGSLKCSIDDQCTIEVERYKNKWKDDNSKSEHEKKSEIEEIKKKASRDKIMVDYEISKFTAGERNKIFAKNRTRNFLTDLVEKYFVCEDDDEGNRKRLAFESEFKDVLTLIEDNRKKHQKFKKTDMESLCKEILGDEKGLFFNIGSAYLVRTSDYHFVCIGGTKEEWGHLFMMSMKYLQDRGDPWRCMVKIFGSPEYKSGIIGIARQNSIRMKATGHTENFLATEILFDVIQNYQYNLARGYAAVRTIDFKEGAGGKPEINWMKTVVIDEATGRVKIDKYTNKPIIEDLKINVTAYQKRDGTWTLKPPEEKNQGDYKLEPILGDDGKPIPDKNGNTQYSPVTKQILTKVPDVASKTVHDKNILNSSDTPPPEFSHLANFETSSLGIPWPLQESHSVIKSFSTGPGTGDYCLCGSLTPRTSDGKVPDSTINRSRLVSESEIKNMGIRSEDGAFQLDFESLCLIRQFYDHGQTKDMTNEQKLEHEKQQALRFASLSLGANGNNKYEGQAFKEVQAYRLVYKEDKQEFDGNPPGKKASDRNNASLGQEYAKNIKNTAAAKVKKKASGSFGYGDDDDYTP